MMFTLEQFISSCEYLSRRTVETMADNERQAHALVESGADDSALSAHFVSIGRPQVSGKDGYPYIGKCRWAHIRAKKAEAKRQELIHHNAEFDARHARSRAHVTAGANRRKRMAGEL
jgi:hypothetical protein